MADKIQKTDTLNAGREKLNKAIDDADRAKWDSGQALTKSMQALTKSDSMQSQLDTLIIESGTSDAEVLQSRVKANQTSFPTLRDRLNDTDNVLSLKANEGDVPKKQVQNTTAGRWWSSSATQLSFNNGNSHVPMKSKNGKQRIVFLGSSTTEGTGTTDRENKSYMKLLENKLTGEGYEFYVRGVGGDNTQSAIDRFYVDVTPLNPDFIIIALTLGNEGIYDSPDKKGIYSQFKEGILKLIRMSQQYGITPIVANQAPTNDYTDEIYRYALQMNSELEAMGIFCVDWMGAVNNLVGKPFPAAMNGSIHYNDVGHVGLANSIPPSIFKRISLQKGGYLQSPEGYINTGESTSETPLIFIPQYAITTFTIFLRIKITVPTLASIMSFNGTNRIAVSNIGRIMVYAPADAPNETEHYINDSEWHSIAVTFNDISKAFRVYFDGNLIHSETYSGLALSRLGIAGRPGATLPLRNVDIKDVLIYRSRLTNEQVQQLHDGTYSQTSLELFAPLHDVITSANTSLINLAPTTSNLVVNPDEQAIIHKRN